MPNPYHDENGRFCSKGEMQAAVDRLADTGKINEYFKLRSELEQLSQKPYEHIPKKNRKLPSKKHSDQTIIPEELRHKKPVNDAATPSSAESYLRSVLERDSTSSSPTHELRHPRPVNDLDDSTSPANYMQYSGAMKTLLHTFHDHEEPVTIRQANALKDESTTSFWNGYQEALHLEGLGEKPEDYDTNEVTQQLLSSAGLRESIFIHDNVEEMLKSSYRAGYRQGGEDS